VFDYHKSILFMHGLTTGVSSLRMAIATKHVAAKNSNIHKIKCSV